VQKSSATKAAGGRAALVIAPQWVGDAIMSLPLMDQLASDYESVDVMAVPAVAPVYECCPSVNKIHITPFVHGQLQWGLRRQVAKEFQGHYQTAVVLPNSIKSALVPWLAGIPVRRGMLGESRYLLINDRRATPPATGQPHRSRPSMLDQYLALADRPPNRESIDRFGAHRPVMAIPRATTEAKPSAELPELAFDGSLKQRLLVICPGAEYGPAKQWPTDFFAGLADHWISTRSDHAVLIVGGPNDVGLGQDITSKLHHKNRVFDLCGKTTLRDAFVWITAAQIVVSNDSGLMHAAAALGTPVVGIFGSSDPHHTPPHARTARAVSLGLDCSPCFQRTCPLGTTACLKNLPVSMVIAAVNELIADAPSAHGATVHASL
jgi:heptosyltransferase II